jgi:hypothetical protein
LALGSGCATTTGEMRVAAASPRSEARWETRGAKVTRGSVTLTTGRVFTRADMQRQTSTNYFGDEAYAEVNSAWLPKFNQEFRRELHRLGIVRWNDRFDCNRFAELFIALAQARFYRESFHSDTPARALAMGPYWYVREDGRGTHAVVQVLTERGRIFVGSADGGRSAADAVGGGVGVFSVFLKRGRVVGKENHEWTRRVTKTWSRLSERER